MNIRMRAARVNESKCPFESLKPAAPRGGAKSLIMPKWCQCAAGALSMLGNLRPAARSLALLRVTARVCAGLAARQLDGINSSAKGFGPGHDNAGWQL